MKKKLVLINPVNPARPGLSFNKSSRFPPISLGIVAGLTPPDWEIVLVDENWDAFTWQEADLVGITAFTASAPRAYEIAAIYRAKGIPVVMGGIHASLFTQEALKYVDAVVVGEAENVWQQVVADFTQGAMQRCYTGGQCHAGAIAHPRRDIFNPAYTFASVQTSRGCPMDCEFCSVTVFNGHQYRRRPVADVLDELESIQQPMIFFVDDNIVGYGKSAKAEVLALFKGMVERKLNKQWFCQASLNFADDEEILFWAAKAGCKMVFLGLEAEEVDALQAANKNLNLQRGVGAYQKLFRRIQRTGIAVLGAFIFGFDGDTPVKLAHRGRYMIKSGVDVMQTTVLTPLPGTRLFNHLMAAGRLLYTNFPEDWAHYDMTEVVFKPQGMSPEELMTSVKQANKKMYSSTVLMKKMLSTLIYTRSFIAAMFAFSSNQNYRQMAKASAHIQIDAKTTV